MSYKLSNIVKCTMTFFFMLLNVLSYANSPDWDGAQWIWQQDDGPSNTWMSFRKTIIIEELPDEVEAHIAVDSKFWLWINGEMLLFEGGLSRGPSQAGEWDRKEKLTPANSWYEAVNIQPYLKKGKNTIAILVWYWGRETHKGTHIDSGRVVCCFQRKLEAKKWFLIHHGKPYNTLDMIILLNQLVNLWCSIL